MRRKRDEAMVIYGDGSYGKRVDSQFPEGVLAFLQEHEQATPERLERARAFWPERHLSDFELRQTGPSEQKCLFVDKVTGEEFRRDPSAALLEPNPSASDIVSFVDAAGRMHFLRPRGPQAPSEIKVLVTSVVGRRLS